MYIQNVVDGKTTTNYGTGIPINDGSTPAKTLTATYRSKCPMEIYQAPPSKHADYTHGMEVRRRDIQSQSTTSHGGGIEYLRRNPASVAKNRPCTLDEPSRTIVSNLYRGVPYGLFYPQGKKDDGTNSGTKFEEVSDLIHNHAGSKAKFRKLDGYRGDELLPLDGPSKTIRANHHMNIEGFDVNEKYEGDDELSQLKPLLDALPKLPPNGLTSIELFAGGGLMRLGVEHAGITTIWANDFNKGACRAHEYNFGEGSIVQGDITEIPIESIPHSDIIVGGPSCQSWSVAGKGEGDKDPRGQMIWRYLEIVAAKQPKAFIFENVKGLISKKHRPTFDSFISQLESLGYNVHWKLINAWDYGVAQKRERVFAIGIRRDLGFTYEFPSSEYELTGYRPVLRDAIGDLPEPNDTRNHQNEEFPRYVQNILDGKSKTNFGKMPFANENDLARTMLATYGNKKPTEILHTYAPRRFSVRECLRIQSVPDTYVFPDDMSLSAMYRVTGNGVPSRVAYHLAAALSAQLLV